MPGESTSDFLNTTIEETIKNIPNLYWLT